MPVRPSSSPPPIAAAAAAAAAATTSDSASQGIAHLTMSKARNIVGSAPRTATLPLPPPLAPPDRYIEAEIAA